MTWAWNTRTRSHLAFVGFCALACSAMPDSRTFGAGTGEEPSTGGTASPSGGTASSAGGAASAPGATTTGGATSGGTGGTSGAGAVGGGRPDGDEPCAPVTERRVRRLTQEQYELVVTDLLGYRPHLFGWTAPDVLVRGFDTDASALTISSGNFDDFALTAELVADAADLSGLAACDGGTEPDACTSTFVTSFAERAFGRPLLPDERERLAGVVRAGAHGDGHEAGVRLAIEAVLLSPYFLYRTELGDGAHGPGGDVTLSALEVASALSFAVTGTRPDDALRERAENDPAFLSESVLREESARLMAKPRAREHLARFLRSWLGIRDIRAINKIPALHPTFTPVLKADLDHEIALFLEQVLASGGTLEALFGSSVTFANSRIMNDVYAFDYAGGAAPVVPADGSFVPFPLEASRRRGVLSLGGWLSAHSPVHRSSPVDRGLAVRSRLFCQTLPPPPPDALFAAPGGSDGVTTTRQKFEMHTSVEACAGCHVLMDPIGFGFEMMDAMGRFRDNELGLPIDSSGMLADTDVDGPFTGPAELSEKLVASAAVRDCFVTQLFRYVEGRDERPADDCELSRMKRAFSAGGGNIAALLGEMVLERAFGSRKVEP